ncbi:hypothetical protein P692DRAFT_20876319 [Suillus brevipes Sb2]|nr:hypothetical protein P692DRAFT_20876319 [Suillus brevipes Sb2]
MTSFEFAKSHVKLLGRNSVLVCFQSCSDILTSGITRNITDGAGLEFKDEYGLFLDQLISVLKSLVENAQMPLDEALSIDLGSILHILVGFISRFSDPASCRIRVKFRALCDSIPPPPPTIEMLPFFKGSSTPSSPLGPPQILRRLTPSSTSHGIRPCSGSHSRSSSHSIARATLHLVSPH